jgi:hypothetical protein
VQDPNVAEGEEDSLDVNGTLEPKNDVPTTDAVTNASDQEVGQDASRQQSNDIGQMESTTRGHPWCVSGGGVSPEDVQDSSKNI